MKPLNLIALLLFLGGATWALTRSERMVREIQGHYYSAMRPFLKTGSVLETKARSFLEETHHSKELETKLDAMQGEVGRLRVIESRFRQLEKENADFRQALNFKKATNFDVVAAQVIRRQPATWWQTVEIDAGEKQGIGTQLAVLSNEGLVGKIDRPDRERSSVILLTDEKCQVSARVEGTQEVGILSGQRGNQGRDPQLRLKFLTKDASLRPGQRVFTTGRGGIFQAN
ncbi:MAG: rod shape-determining protein MreC, partial [Luteolibacter sp.]